MGTVGHCPRRSLLPSLPESWQVKYMGTVGHCPHRSLLQSLPESGQVSTWELLDTVLTEACCQVYRSRGREVHGNCWTLSLPKLVAKSTGVRAGRYMGTVGHCHHRSLLPNLSESGQVGSWELLDTVLTGACCQVYGSQGRLSTWELLDTVLTEAFCQVYRSQGR